jgi:hypothetical protein
MVNPPRRHFLPTLKTLCTLLLSKSTTLKEEADFKYNTTTYQINYLVFMATEKSGWKKGRGKLGVLEPLIGSWVANSDSPMGKIKCTRTFKPTLAGKYIELTATWEFTKGAYQELAIYGIKDDKLCFWSFTSDGKRSEGCIADGTDVHKSAICFEANMPAGVARMVYWPGENGGLNWAVESKNKKGWNRFTEHSYSKI